MSLVLSAVLCKATNFSLNGIVLARLDRAELGDFDAFVLGSLMSSLFPGQVVIPDFGFYGRPHQVALIRQDRLIAGITTLAEVPVTLQQHLLTIPTKTASGATYEDAARLAQYEGIVPRTMKHGDFIDEAME
jgi:hypothetical protein